MFKELYLKSIKLAGHKKSKFFLGFISFIESFIFPIPPDVIIIPMTIAKRHEWIKIALIATIGSVLGACLGYFIGYVFFNEIGIKIFELYGVDNISFLKEKMSTQGGVVAWMRSANHVVIAKIVGMPICGMSTARGLGCCALPPAPPAPNPCRAFQSPPQPSRQPMPL